MRSLRFRIPAIFLVGILVAGVVTAALAIRFFQDYTHDRVVGEIRRQATGLAQLYEDSLLSPNKKKVPGFAASVLEDATGSRIYYSGIEIVPAGNSGLRTLDRSFINWETIEAGQVESFEFVPPDADLKFLAAAHPIESGGTTVGALIVAKPRAEPQSRWPDLLERTVLALGAGLLVALGLVWYMSQRLTKPVLALSRAADQVASGRYDFELPRGHSNDEIGQLTERFREMAERLEESQRRERTFLMVVSHELRTPVTAIRGHVDALREGLADDTEARDASLAVIRSETDRLARLIGDILDLARMESHQFTLEEDEVEVKRLLEQAFQTFTEEARRRGIEYECSLNANPVISTDGDRLLQIVSNLLDNAFAWTPDGGRVALALAADNGTIAVSVSDSGPGIGPQERGRIFKPFWTRAGDGTGLGLPIARHLAEAMGGELALQSEIGRGSRFVLRLPVR